MSSSTRPGNSPGRMVAIAVLAIIALWAGTFAVSVILQRFTILYMTRAGETVQFDFRRRIDGFRLALPKRPQNGFQDGGRCVAFDDAGGAFTARAGYLYLSFPCMLAPVRPGAPQRFHGRCRKHGAWDTLEPAFEGAGAAVDDKSFHRTFTYDNLLR